MKLSNRSIGFIIIATIGLIFNFFQSKRISKHLNNARIKYNVPAVGIGHFSGIMHRDIYISGERKIGSGVLAEKDDPFHIGSCTKIFTATLFGIFVDEGKIAFNTRIKDIFPEYDAHPYIKNITAEMLLQHISGVASDLSRDDWKEIAFSGLSLKEQREIAVQKIIQMQPEFEPYSDFAYSNNGYIILGAMLERVSGKSWEELIIQYIFAPLNMRHSGFGPPGKNSTNITAPWPHIGDKYPQAINPNNTFDPENYTGGVISDNPAFYGPAATIHCSVGDMITFLKKLIDGYKGYSSSFLSKSTSYYLFSGNVTKNNFRRYEDMAFISTGSNTMNFAIIILNLEHSSGFIGFTNFAGKNLQQGNKAIASIFNKIMEEKVRK